MTLSPTRTRSYLAAALTGAFAAVALVAGRRRRRAAVPLALAALCCGALAVGYEERAQAVDGRPEEP